MFSSIGITALIGMLSHLLFIYITWRVITTINFDPLIRKGRETEARLLIILLPLLSAQTSVDFPRLHPMVTGFAVPILISRALPSYEQQKKIPV